MTPSPLKAMARPLLTAGAVLVLTFAAAGCGPNANPAKPAAGGQVIPEEKQADALNAYVVAFNKLVDRNDFGDILEEYRKDNPQAGKAGAAVTGYDFSTSDVDVPLEEFKAAQAMTPPVAELAGPGKAVIDALETLNPLLKEASAYSTQKGYVTDKGAKAHSLDAPLVAALQNAEKASKAFGAALSAQTLKRDQARLAALKPGGVDYHKLKVSLEVRQLGGAVDAALDDKAQIPALETRLQSLVAANTELGGLKKDPKAEPAWDPVCAMYKSEVDRLIGRTNTLIEAIRAGARPAIVEAYKAWFDTRNDTVDKANAC